MPGPRRARKRATGLALDLGSMSSIDPMKATFTSCPGSSSMLEQVAPLMGSKVAADSRMDGTATPTWSSGNPFINQCDMNQ